MVKVTYNGTVLAESNDTVVVEGNHYFPPSSVKTEFFTKSPTRTVCPWKGMAWYYTLKVDGKEIKDAAWYYPEASDKAASIKDHVAFYKNKVTITNT